MTPVRCHSQPTQCAYIGLWRGGAARPLRTPGIPCPGGARGRAEAIAPAPRRRRRSRRNAAPRAPPAACRRRSSPAGRGGRRCLCAAVAWPEMSLPAAVARSFRWPARPPSCRCYHRSAQCCRRPATPAPGASDDRPTRDRRQPYEGGARRAGGPCRRPHEEVRRNHRRHRVRQHRGGAAGGTAPAASHVRHCRRGAAALRRCGRAVSRWLVGRGAAEGGTWRARPPGRRP